MRKKLDVRTRGRVRNPIMKQGKTTAKIRVRLDSKTIIMVQDMAAFNLWKAKYPNAEVISDKS